MKKRSRIFILIACILSVLSLNDYCQAEEFELEARINRYFYEDDRLESNYGPEFRLKDNGKFLYLSLDRTHNKFCGQNAGAIDIYAIGLGLEKKITKDINVFIGVGYYYPKSSMEKRKITWEGNDLANTEAMYLEMNEQLSGSYPARRWDYYLYELNPNIGGMVGLDLVRNIEGNLYFKLSASYRYLKFGEALYGKDESPDTEGWWELFSDRNFSSCNLTVAFEYRF